MKACMCSLGLMHPTQISVHLLLGSDRLYMVGVGNPVRRHIHAVGNKFLYNTSPANQTAVLM